MLQIAHGKVLAFGSSPCYNKMLYYKNQYLSTE